MAGLIKIEKDSAYDYKWSVDGNKYGDTYDVTTQGGFDDTNLTNDGWERILKVNGSLFYTYDGKHYACGLEKSRGANNQELEMSCVTDYNSCMSIACIDDELYFNSQEYIINNKLSSAYGAITGLGLILNGSAVDSMHSGFTTQWNQLSGRTIIGTDSEGNFLSYSVAGTTGVSGLTGAQAQSKCLELGFYNAIMLDGGGSVFREYNSKYDISTTRKVKNTLILYRKKKAVVQYTLTLTASPTAGGVVSPSQSSAYDAGTNVAISAKPNENYKFSKWSDGDTNDTRIITLNANTALTATFYTSTGEEDNSQTGEVAGLMYAYVDSNLKKVKQISSKISNNNVSNLKGIYKYNGSSLVPLLLKYSVTYNVNGGNSVSNGSYFYGTGISSLPTPTHSNYDSRAVSFNGWYNNSSFSNKISKVGTTATGNKTYYAKWTQSKTVYSGTYTYSTSASKTITAYSSVTNSSGLSGKTLDWKDSSKVGTFSQAITVTHISKNFDYCTSSWENYIKPTVYYGYWTGNTFTQKGTLYTTTTQTWGTEADTNFVIPAGSYLGFKTYINDGVSRQKAFSYEGSYKYTITSSGTVSKQDSSSPPQGSWASGSPTTSTMTRYYNGSSWTSWS